MERCPSDCRASDYHVSDGRAADQGGDGQGRGAAPAAPTLGKVVCGHPLPITDLLGYIIIFESLRTVLWCTSLSRAASDRTERRLASHSAARFSATGRLCRHAAAALHGRGAGARSDTDLAGAAPASGDPASAAHTASALPPRSSSVSRQA